MKRNKITNGPFDKIVEGGVNEYSERIANLNAFFWDEYSMNSAHDLELIHRICSRVRGNDLPFGGIQFTSIGDWPQLAPVLDNMYINDENLKMYNSRLFYNLRGQLIELDITYRQDSTDINYASFRKVLDDLWEGNCSEESERFITEVLWPRWHSGKALGSQSKGRVFDTGTGHI